MTDDPKYNIEDFWPGAENLLDQHFQKKRGWTTFMKSIVLGLLLAIVGGTFGYLYFDSTSGKVESKLATQSNEGVDSELNTPQQNSNKTPENNLTNQQKSTSTIELGLGYNRITPFPNLAVSVIETKDLKFSET